MGVRDDIVAYARRQIGCSYDYTPSGGVEGRSYNCSFLTTCAYRAAGLVIPHWQGHQNGDGSQSDWVWRAGHWTTDPDQLKPGDLVFFGTSRTNTGHVGISLGGNRMIDSIPNGGVQERRLQSNFVGGGWPLSDEEEGEFMRVKFLCNMNIRTKPSGKEGKVVGSYAAGETAILDSAVAAGGYIWGSYLGSQSGARRYVAIAGPTGVFVEAA